MTDEAIIHVTKAGRALREAQALLDLELTEGACNRAYYAMFLAAHAALKKQGVETAEHTIKTHNGLVTIFSKEIIRAGLLDVSYGQYLNKVMNYRLIADYHGDQPSLEDTGDAVRLAQQFVAGIETVFFGKTAP